MRGIVILTFIIVSCLVMTVAFTLIVPQFSQTSEISTLEVNPQLVLRLIRNNDATKAQAPGSGGGGGGTI